MLILTAFFSLLMGTAHITLKQLLGMILGEPGIDHNLSLIVFKIRLPRILLAGLTGFTLSLGGVIFQAILRNPLADPFILGVSSGGAFGAVVAIILGFGMSIGIPLMSFAGSFLTIFLVLSIGKKNIGMESTTILLSGVIINAFFSAIIMFFIATTVDDRLHTMLFWLYGDLSQSVFSESAVIFPVTLISFIALYGFSRHLNLLTAGEESALQLGVDVERTKLICIILVSMGTGVIVAFSGLIGFVGLIMPHVCRMIIGSDHRLLLPVSCLGGAIFLIIADTLARTIFAPNELPVGVITAFIGAPFFVYLLLRRGRQWNHS